MTTIESALAYARDHREPFLQDLIEFIKIPSISAQPAHAGDVRAAANWLAAHLNAIGFQSSVKETTTAEVRGHPVVYAEHLGAGPSKPTILIYGHYDVQPPDPLDLWHSAPFAAEVRNGQIFARGADDNKGQHMAHIKAGESYLKSGNALPVNVKFLIEGEEEIGGPNLGAFIAAHQALLACDAVLVSDGALLNMTQPVISYGLRGLVGLEVELRALNRDVHSGMYGGNVQNPAVVLAQIIAKLKDKKGRVAVPGFYNDVRVMSDAERAELARSPYGKKQVLAETGALKLFGDPAFTVNERKGGRPTLEINGLWSGYTGPGSKTIIPATAHCKITCRLVPNMNPDKVLDMVAAYIQKLTPRECTVNISRGGGAPGVLVDRNSPFMEAAVQAAEATYGNRPIFELEGGSIPVVGDFQKHLGKPVILLGFGLMDDNIHSPNEKYAVACYEKGIEASIRFLHAAAQVQ
jgi:acetylornithine deacetylase/succinyl-diaminopimelate desuccinylase-like protein